MAGPIADKVILPLDTGNTGKKVRTQTKVIGPDTVHEHFFIQERKAMVLGVYGASSAVLSTAAAAMNGTSTGHIWLHVPVAVSGKKVRIRRLLVRHGLSAATPTCPTTPRVAASLFTFTGTASGAAITPGKYDSTYPTQVLDLRTAVTGLTVTMGAIIGHSLTPVFLLSGTVADIMQGVAAPDPVISIGADEDEWPVLSAGQGICIWQADAGTTSYIRRLTVDVVWDEIDTA